MSRTGMYRCWVAPAKNDWILNGLVFDPSLLHDYLAYSFFRNLGHYASRTIFCELFINGDYRGVYMLQEKIKIDGNRINLMEMSVTDNANPAVTGGYIIKADKTTGGRSGRFCDGWKSPERL